MTENGNKKTDSGKKIYTYIQIGLAILFLLNMILVAPLRSEINNLSDCIAALEKEQLPQIRSEQAEIRAQLREQQVKYDNIEKSLDKIEKHLEYIRRRIE